MKNQKGVTLLELIIVMVIITIGATLMAPGISSWMPHYRLRSATRDIASMMRIAQMKAVSINTNYGVRFPSATTYILEYLTTGGWVSEGAQETLPAGVQFTAFPPLNGGPDPNFQFYPNSMASTGGLTLNNAKGATKTVFLGLTGRIKIE